MLRINLVIFEKNWWFQYDLMVSDIQKDMEIDMYMHKYIHILALTIKPGTFEQ